MSNTLSSSLVVDRLADRAITKLQNKLAPLSSFSTLFKSDTIAPRSTIQVPVGTVAASVQTNPSNYESGDHTVTNAAVSVNEQVVSFHLTSQEQMQGQELERVADLHLAALGDKLWDTVAALITTAYTNTAVTVAQASIASANLQSLWASIAKGSSKNLVLDSTAFSKFLPTNLESFKPGAGAYGFDGFNMATKWDQIGYTNVYGFAASPEAMAVAGGLPEVHPAVAALLLEQGTVEIPGLGMKIAINVWGSTSSRAVWMSYGAMFGAARADVTALTVIKSA
jgi:hypothetical protein